VEEVGGAVQRIDEPAVRAVGADDLLTLLAEEAVGRTRLQKLFLDDLLRAEIGLRDEVAGSLDGDLQVLDLAEIARQRLAGLERGLNHDIEES